MPMFSQETQGQPDTQMTWLRNLRAFSPPRFGQQVMPSLFEQEDYTGNPFYEALVRQFGRHPMSHPTGGY